MRSNDNFNFPPRWIKYSVMLCYVMYCYVMLCYVMLCYVMNILPKSSQAGEKPSCNWYPWGVSKCWQISAALIFFFFFGGGSKFTSWISLKIMLAVWECSWKCLTWECVRVPRKRGRHYNQFCKIVSTEELRKTKSFALSRSKILWPCFLWVTCATC